MGRDGHDLAEKDFPIRQKMRSGGAGADDRGGQGLPIPRMEQVCDDGDGEDEDEDAGHEERRKDTPQVPW